MLTISGSTHRGVCTTRSIAEMPISTQADLNTSSPSNIRGTPLFTGNTTGSNYITAQSPSLGHHPRCAFEQLESHAALSKQTACEPIIGTSSRTTTRDCSSRQALSAPHVLARHPAYVMEPRWVVSSPPTDRQVHQQADARRNIKFPPLWLRWAGARPGPVAGADRSGSRGGQAGRSALPGSASGSTRNANTGSVEARRGLIF